MKQHIEKTEQLIKRIDDILDSNKVNIEYDDEFQRMRLNIQKIDDWASSIKQKCNDFSFAEDEEIARIVTKLIYTCEDIIQRIKIDETTELSLPKLKEALIEVKSTQEQALNQESYADIMDKILLIEESYQNGEIDAEKAVKELIKLEKTEILQNGSVQSNQLKEIITKYKIEMGVTTDSEKQYIQEIKPVKSLEETYVELEEITNNKLNELLDLEDSSNSYRPEFEYLCERVDLITRNFVDAEVDLYDSDNLNDLFNETIKLEDQYNSAYSEQRTKFNQNGEKELLDQTFKHLATACDVIAERKTLLLCIESQLEKQFSQIKKFEELSLNMPPEVFKECYKFIYNHFYNILKISASLNRNGSLTQNLLTKCEQAYTSLQNFYTNAQQHGIKL